MDAPAAAPDENAEQLELASIHDFGAKLAQPGSRDALEHYVRWQVALRDAEHADAAALDAKVVLLVARAGGRAALCAPLCFPTGQYWHADRWQTWQACLGRAGGAPSAPRVCALALIVGASIEQHVCPLCDCVP